MNELTVNDDYDTAATLFPGGGGADMGLSAAGLDVKWGLEYDDNIAQVARENGLNIHTADVTKVDPDWYERVDVLHASPPCPNFSIAKTGAEETDEDVSLAHATVRFVQALEPALFTLENVWGYRKSQSWKLIREHLQQNGYDWNGWHLNCADYGAPQTRKRMIVAARKGGPRPKKPAATHAEDPSSGGLFDDTLDEWVGWYEAIEDLIPDLPETELADWQKERLPDEVKTVLIDGKPMSFGGELQPNRASDPVQTISASNQKHMPRAVLVPGGNGSSFVTRTDGQPSRTISKQPGNCDRAVMGRRVVQMTPRCLARFQAFPDWYELPNSKSLACRIIGNAVPPLAMKIWVGYWGDGEGALALLRPKAGERPTEAPITDEYDPLAQAEDN